MAIVPLSADTLCTPAHISRTTADALRPFGKTVRRRPE
jgi:hypothetical protein